MTTTRLELTGLHLDVETTSAPEPTDGGWLLPAGAVRVSHPFGATGFYRHGWHSWSPARWVSLANAPRTVHWYGAQADDLQLLAGDRHRGRWVGALEAGDGNVLLLGALGVDGTVEADDSELTGSDDGAGWFLGHGRELEVFDNYAQLLGDRLGSRVTAPGRVWCSWYSFYLDISEEKLHDVLAGLSDLPFDVFQIDDGWERHVGDWQPNERFPSGMAALAERIEAAGYRPGLWLAPFIAHEDSEVFNKHPELLVADADGTPAVASYNWGGNYYALDLTNPDARDAVWHSIRQARDWGFSYLKLDFLFAAAIPGVRRDNEISREAAYRSGVELIRDAAGDDAYLLACGAPIVPSIGVFDGLRIGPDVAPFWEWDGLPAALLDHAAVGTRRAISTSLHRLWLRDLTAVDPDVAYFRTRYCLLDDVQRRCLQDLVAITDFVATSDPPGWLAPDEREALGGFLRDRPAVTRLDRYRFDVGGRTVDFRDVVIDDPELLTPPTEDRR